MRKRKKKPQVKYCRHCRRFVSRRSTKCPKCRRAVRLLGS